MPGLEILTDTSPTIVPLWTLVSRVRKKIEPEPWEDKLLASYTAGQTPPTISVGQPSMWAEGDTMEADDSTGSAYRVISQAPIMNPISVKVGHNNTTDANHVVGTTILKNPEFSYDIINEALTRATAAVVYPWGYVVNSFTLNPSTSVPFYDVPGDFIALVGATQKITNGPPLVVREYGTGGLPITVRNSLRSDISAHTQAFSFPNGIYTMDYVIQVFYIAKVNTSTIPEGDIAEFIVLKACEFLAGQKEMPLTASDQSGPTPPPGAVPGSRLRSSLWFKQESDALKKSIQAQSWMVAPPIRRWFS